MKKTVLALFFAGIVALVQAQNFEVLTKKPVAGGVVTIEYMPRNTVLQGHNDFEAIAYLMEGGEPRAKSVLLKQQGGLFKGSVKTNDSTKAVFFLFAKDELRDNNKDEGYFTPLYTKKGELVPGAQLAIGNGFAIYSFYLDLKRNKEKAVEWMGKEFSSATAPARFRKDYFQYLGLSGTAPDKAQLKDELDKLVAGQKASEAELMDANGLYQRFLENKEKGSEITAQIKERFPNGAWRLREVSEAFRKAKTMADKEKVFEGLAALGPVKKEDQGAIDYMAGQLARMAADSGNYGAMKKYIDVMAGSAKAAALNSIAWKMSGEGLSRKPVNVDIGLQLSERSMELVSQEMREMKSKYPSMTETEYRKNLQNTFYSYNDTYGVLLYQKGDYVAAYAAVKKSVDHFKRKNNNINENFAAITEKVKGPEEAQAQLETFLEEGKYTPAMKEQLKKIYLGHNHTEAQWMAYLGNLEEAAYNKLKAELMKKIINQPAPQFALKNIEGQPVALSSLKGKVVVIDFWATWCGPCIASFPGMQKAVNRFKNNPDVVFLFIDTWENDSNRVQKVTDFIARNKYSFNVLYDEAKAKTGNDFKVIEDYKVDGIPTKFVIDRNNNIRFKSVGYNGNPEATFNEVTAMVDIAAAESGATIKKAF